MAQELEQKLVQALDDLNGYHPGFRPAHAKGVMLTGVFHPTQAGGRLTKAPHLHRESTPVTVRFSDSAGFPTVGDNDQEHASPRGFAVRFHLGEHEHTDIISHSVDGFPVRTAEEFLELLQAIGKTAAGDSAKPSPIEVFLGSHPAALRFVQAPKSIPASFAQESYFSVNALEFVNSQGDVRYGRYRILPDAGNKYLTTEEAKAKGPNFLMEEIAARVSAGPVKMSVCVQIAADGDVVDDATVKWPDNRREVPMGALELRAMVPEDNEDARRIIFDPIPRVEGIEVSGDPLLEPRAAVYLMTGRRRRSAGTRVQSA